MAQESWKFDKEETGCQPPDGPIYCSNNCGFFGNKATMNMCSKCYRDLVLAQASASSLKPDSGKAALTTSTSKLVDRIVEVDIPSQAKPITNAIGTASPKFVTEESCSVPGLASALSSRPANRCFVCNKRVGLTGFTCRCGDIFCSSHRYSDKHDCTFDYKSAGRHAILMANPLVKADKIDKI